MDQSKKPEEAWKEGKIEVWPCTHGWIAALMLRGKFYYSGGATKEAAIQRLRDRKEIGLPKDETDEQC